MESKFSFEIQMRKLQQMSTLSPWNVHLVTQKSNKG